MAYLIFGVIANPDIEQNEIQGCPLCVRVYCFRLLFVIGIELLSNAIQKDPAIKGIQVGQKEIKITQYADDTTPPGDG